MKRNMAANDDEKVSKRLEIEEVIGERGRKRQIDRHKEGKVCGQSSQEQCASGRLAED